MTERLYYDDSFLVDFDATITAAVEVGGRPAVVLDRTAFYPTSGGQPCDTGVLDDVRVVDVVERDVGSIAHVLEAPLAAGRRVRGAVDWPRRFDHMQQHTGQHVLSAAFVRAADVATVSFHLGRDAATIDLAREVAAAEVARAEALANDVVWENRPVRVRTATEAEAAGLPLRKEPARTGPLRLVEVADFDLSACGGTHVPATGVIGMVAVAGTERVKGGTRVTFVCGGRALGRFRRDRDVVAAASRLLSVGGAEVPAAIERLQAEVRAAAHAARDLRVEAAARRAADLRAAAETIGPLRAVLSSITGWDAAALKALASAVVSEPGFVAILTGEGAPVPVVAARSADVGFDAGAWLRAAASTLGGRGGGRPELAQGGLANAPARILAFAREALEAHGRGRVV